MLGLIYMKWTLHLIQTTVVFLVFIFGNQGAGQRGGEKGKAVMLKIACTHYH